MPEFKEWLVKQHPDAGGREYTIMRMPSAKQQMKADMLECMSGDPDRAQCPICLRQLDADLFEIDHFVPLSAGGSSEIWNLWAICVACNRRKGKHASLKEWNLWDEADRIALEFRTFQREMSWSPDVAEMYQHHRGNWLAVRNHDEEIVDVAEFGSADEARFVAHWLKGWRLAIIAEPVNRAK